MGRFTFSLFDSDGAMFIVKVLQWVGECPKAELN